MAAQAGRLLLNLFQDDAELAEPVVPGPPPEPESSPDDESFWPSSAAGLVSCGLFAWTAAAISVYQVWPSALCTALAVHGKAVPCLRGVSRSRLACRCGHM